MAEVTLHRGDLKSLSFPPFCIRCGRRSVGLVTHTFWWTDDELGPFAGLLALLLRRRLSIAVPVCKRHKAMWWWRNLLIFSPIFFLASLLAIHYSQNGEAITLSMLAVFALCTLGFIVSFICLLFGLWRHLAVRASYLDLRTAVLTGVSPKFVDEFQPTEKVLDEAPPVPEQQTIGTEPPGLFRWGFGFFVLGVSTFILPLFGLQWRPMNNIGDARTTVALAMIGGGALLMIIERIRKKR